MNPYVTTLCGYIFWKILINKRNQNILLLKNKGCRHTVLYFPSFTKPLFILVYQRELKQPSLLNYGTILSCATGNACVQLI